MSLHSFTELRKTIQNIEVEIAIKKNTLEELREQLHTIELKDCFPLIKEQYAFFKVKNCYSCPETDADYWPIYHKLIGYEDGNLLFLSFSKPNPSFGKDKQIEFTIRRYDFPYIKKHIEDCGYERITEEEFNQVFKGFLLEIQNLGNVQIK